MPSGSIFTNYAMSVTILQADFNNREHTEHIVNLTNAYAQDEMGGGTPLPEKVRKKLIAGLQAMPTSLVLLAFDDGEPVGIANCFWGFSTFHARKLINIHDLAVLPGARGKGVGKALINKVKEIARNAGCCKVTLEVLENNPARRLYEREGFEYGNPPYYFMSCTL